MLTFLAKLTRWNNWNQKIPPVFTAGYIWILQQTPTPDYALIRFIALVAFAAVFLAFVFAVNDFSDREVDQQAGKPNAISELSSEAAIGWLIAFVGAGVLILAPFYQQQWLAVFMVISYILAAAYSMPPVRSKERGLVGLLTAATHRSLPVLVGMALFNNFQLSSWLLFALFTLVGVRWNFLHQLQDLPNDEQTQVNTFARVCGHDRTVWLLKTVVIPMELICLLVWFALTSLQLPAVFLLAPAYSIWWLLRRRGNEPAIVSWTGYDYEGRPLRDFYEDFCPLFLGMLLAIQEPTYLVMLLLQVIWQRHRSLRSLWKNKLLPIVIPSQ